jgi:hypothetical protein
VLQQVLQELEMAQGPLSLGELSRRLDIDRDALRGMIEFWVRRGRLQNHDEGMAATLATCPTASCSGCHLGPQDCSSATNMPRMYSLVRQQDEPDEPRNS